MPYRDADPYDGVNYYYEFDIALPGLPYSTSNRGVVVLSFGKTVLIMGTIIPSRCYTDDHYATFQEFLNYRLTAKDLTPRKVELRIFIMLITR